VRCELSLRILLTKDVEAKTPDHVPQDRIRRFYVDLYDVICPGQDAPRPNARL